MSEQLLPNVSDREVLTVLADALRIEAGDPAGCLRDAAGWLAELAEALLWSQNDALNTPTENCGRHAVDAAALLVLFDLRAGMLALARKADAVG